MTVNSGFSIASAVLVGLLGLLVGSFLAAASVRLPASVPITHGRSRCPTCGRTLGPLELVPVLSYLALGGRCRTCKARISPLYPTVELLTGALFALVSWARPVDLALARDLVLTSVLIVAATVDLGHGIIPNRLLVTGLLLWLPLAALSVAAGGALGVSGASGEPPLLAAPVGWVGAWPTLPEIGLGALMGGGFLFLIHLVSRGGMGLGDVKLMALVGLFLGTGPTLVSLFVGFVLGGLAGVLLIALKIKSRKDAIPFGPYLAVGSLVGLIWGNQIVRWYLGG